MGDAYVTLEGWSPSYTRYPVAAMSSYLYPPHVSCSSMHSHSPRPGEGSPTMAARRDTMRGSTFMTDVKSFSGLPSKAPPPTMVPSSFEQQQNRCRCWHHEFHELLVAEVRAVHQRLHHRSRQRQRSGVVPPGSSQQPGIAHNLDAIAADDDLSATGSFLLGEDTPQQQLLSSILQLHPLPYPYYGSVLPNAPKPGWLLPELMSLPMASFLQEFEDACVEGADAVWHHIVQSQLCEGHSLSGSNKASPSNRSDRNSSFSGSPPHTAGGGASGFFGPSHRNANPSLVRPLEDSRGLETENFFVYKHMIFNVLHLMEDDMLSLFGCVENATKAAAAEVRALHQIIQMTCIKGSLTLQGTTAAAGAQGGGAAGGVTGGDGQGITSTAAILSFPLVSLVRLRGIAMFVVAQPNTTPVESVIAGPSTDGVHVPSNLRHTGLLQSLCSMLRVPNPSFFLTAQQQRLMSQCPSIGHPELTVTLATKLSKEYESTVVGDAMIGALFPYRMPYLSATKLRSWLSHKKRTFGIHEHSTDDAEGEEDVSSSLHGAIPTQHTTEVLIVQNVARLVSTAADLSLTTLMPHIVSPMPKESQNVALVTSTSHTPPGKRTPTPPPSSSSFRGPGGSLDAHLGKLTISPHPVATSLLVAGGGSHHKPVVNRYLHSDKGSQLTAMLHPSFLLTLPYDEEVLRCEYADPTDGRPQQSSSSDSRGLAGNVISGEVATRMLLNDRIPAMITWLLHLMDTLGDDSGFFIDNFDGEVLKGLFKAWGCNTRYLGVVHAKITETIQHRLQTVFATLESATKKFLAAKAAQSGVAVVAGNILSSKDGGAGTNGSSSKSSSKKHLIRQTALQQSQMQASLALASSTRSGASGTFQNASVVGVGGGGVTPQPQPVTPTSSSSSFNGKRFGGRLFLSRAVASLDSPKLTSNLQDTIDALSNLLGKRLECDAPAPSMPAQQLQPQPSMARRASVLTAGALSTSSTANTAPLLHPIGAAPPPPPPPRKKVQLKVRSPQERSPIEHLLMVIRAEMIARCFRCVFSEQERILTVQQATTPAEYETLPFIKSGSSRSLTPRQRMSNGTILAHKSKTTNEPMTTSTRTPSPSDEFALNAARLPIVPSKPQVQQSNSARLYQKLKDLDSVWEERNQMSKRTTDEGMTARSIDKIVIMDAVQHSTRYGAPDGSPRSYNPYSVLPDDPHPRFEPDGGVFDASRPSAEKQRISELLRYLVSNGATSTSQTFWQQILMAEMWIKYGNFVGACSKRSDIQAVDMVMVLQRTTSLCGITLTPDVLVTAEQSMQLPQRTASDASSAGCDGWDGADDPKVATRNRVELSHVRLSHHSIEDVRPRVRSTLRRVAHDIVDVGRCGSAGRRQDAAAIRDRARIGNLPIPTEAPLSGIYDEKVRQLERELYDLQEKRFVRSGKKFKEGLGDAATVREMTILDALLRLYHLGGAKWQPFMQLARAQHVNAELVVFYHSVAAYWRRIGFDGICYRPCGSCGVLFNASMTDVHRCGTTTLTKVDREELAVGVGDGKLPNVLISASSSLPGSEPFFARKCVTSAAWRPKQEGHDHFIEFSFSTAREISAMEMYGELEGSRFVKSFQLVYTLEHKDPQVFTGTYFRRDENPNDIDGVTHAIANGGRGVQMRARPFVHNNAARDRERVCASPQRLGLQRHSSEGDQTPEPLGSPTRSAVPSHTFASGTYSPSVRKSSNEPCSNNNLTQVASQRFGQTARTIVSDQSGGNFSCTSYPDLPAAARSTSTNFPHCAAVVGASRSGATPDEDNSMHGNGNRGMRPTFLKGNTDPTSLVRIQFETPFRCNTLRIVVGNEDAATAALNVEFYYTSRPMPSLGRNGCETIAVNHVDWNSELQLSTFGETGSTRNLGGVIPNSMRMTRRELADKEKTILQRILEIEAQVEDTSEATLAKALPYECVLIRTSTELQGLWGQLLQLLIMWGMERSSDVQYAQFRLLRYHLGEVKLYARCDQADIAAARVDRLMKKLDDAVGPLGFGGVAMLVGPLMALIFDALQCAGVAARHIPDFYHMVEWASAVRHPLTVELTAVLIDAAGYGTEMDRAEAAELCETLAAQGRLGDVTKLLERPVIPGIPATTFSPAVVKVFKQIREKELFLQTEGETETSRCPMESEDVQRRFEKESHQAKRLQA